jgi:hypothetical protein
MVEYQCTDTVVKMPQTGATVRVFNMAKRFELRDYRRWLHLTVRLCGFALFLTGMLAAAALADDDKSDKKSSNKRSSSGSTPSPVQSVTSLPKIGDDSGSSSRSSSSSGSSSRESESGERESSGGGSRSSSSETYEGSSSDSHSSSQYNSSSGDSSTPGGGRESRSGKKGGDEREKGDNLPKTVEQMINRWLGSGDGGSKGAPAAQPPAAHASPPAVHTPQKTVPAAGPQQQKTPPAAVNARSTRKPSGANPGSGQSQPSNVVLAVNLSPAGAAHAQKLGFQVGSPAHMGPLGGNVTPLHAPPGLDSATARNLLTTAVPGGQFAVNQIYSLYQPASNQPAAIRDMNPSARYTEPAHVADEMLCRNDHCFGRQIIKWQEYLPSCASNVRIGVIDTAIDHEHPTFSRARLDTGNFVPEGGKPSSGWHGTGVLAILAGDPKSGTPGLIPEADFYVANVFATDASGQVATDTASLLKALDWMDGLDVKVINMSFAGPKDELVQKSIERMAGKGTVFVAAAGNDGPTAAPAYPAAYKPVIAVTAVTKDMRNYPYANRGPQIDVAAPGVDIWTAVPRSREGFHSGTSFAVPYVTAVVATIVRDGPAQEKEQLLNRLHVVDLGPPGRDPIYGRGLLMAPQSCIRPDGIMAKAAPGQDILSSANEDNSPPQASTPMVPAAFR